MDNGCIRKAFISAESNRMYYLVIWIIPHMSNTSGLSWAMTDGYLLPPKGGFHFNNLHINERKIQ